jgi:hypothetical protein
VCPDSLVGGFVGQPYSQVATILPPPSYEYQTIDVPLDHIKLKNVGNLPPGITWVSNSPDSIFMSGQYYCILMEGTPTAAGDYVLRIVVDVYAVIFPGTPAIYLTTVTDSTSLTLVVQDNFGIGDEQKAPVMVSSIVPNPFRGEARVDFTAIKPGPVEFEIFSSIGERLIAKNVIAEKGENSILFDGKILPPGTYFYVLRSGGYRASGMMVRAE